MEPQEIEEAKVSPKWSLTKLTPGIETVPKRRLPGTVELADGSTYEVTYILADYPTGLELSDVIFHIENEKISQGSFNSPEKFRQAIRKKSLSDVFPYRSFDRSGKEISLNQPPVDRILERKEKLKQFFQR